MTSRRDVSSAGGTQLISVTMPANGVGSGDGPTLMYTCRPWRRPSAISRPLVASAPQARLLKCSLALRLATAVDDRQSTFLEQICPLPGRVLRSVIVVLLDFRCQENRQDVFIIGDETLEAVR
jgi:hypothetical protein